MDNLIASGRLTARSWPMSGWEQLARAQEGMLARRQLTPLGMDADRVRNQLAAQRWQARSSTVISTFTGPLTFRHQLWLGVLHAGEHALVGGLTAAAVHGLQHWDRPEVTVLVPYRSDVSRVSGIRFVRTRRAMSLLRDRTHQIPMTRVEPAILMAAAGQRSTRTAAGLLAAAVQQRLTTAERLIDWLVRLRPLRHSRLLRGALTEIAGGAQSMSELDVGRMCLRFGLAPPRRQVRRRDAGGRVRFTDCEWTLPDGRTVVLEVDGSFHMDVDHWEDDMARHRRLSRPDRVVVRCSSRELREEPFRVFSDLAALGVPRL